MLECLMAQGVCGPEHGLNIWQLGSEEVRGLVLPALLPGGWKGCQQVVWAPGADSEDGSDGEQLSLERLQLLWRRLQREPGLEDAMQWPLLPILPSHLRTLSGRRSIVRPGGWTDATQCALVKCGCDIVRSQ
jgi:hypothetical protein